MNTKSIVAVATGILMLSACASTKAPYSPQLVATTTATATADYAEQNELEISKLLPPKKDFPYPASLGYGSQKPPQPVGDSRKCDANPDVKFASLAPPLTALFGSENQGKNSISINISKLSGEQSYVENVGNYIAHCPEYTDAQTGKRFTVKSITAPSVNTSIDGSCGYYSSDSNYNVYIAQLQGLVVEARWIGNTKADAARLYAETIDRVSRDITSGHE